MHVYFVILERLLSRFHGLVRAHNLAELLRVMLETRFARLAVENSLPTVKFVQVVGNQNLPLVVGPGQHIFPLHNMFHLYDPLNFIVIAEMYYNPKTIMTSFDLCHDSIKTEIVIAHYFKIIRRNHDLSITGWRFFKRPCGKNAGRGSFLLTGRSKRVICNL